MARCQDGVAGTGRQAGEGEGVGVPVAEGAKSLSTLRLPCRVVGSRAIVQSRLARGQTRGHTQFRSFRTCDRNLIGNGNTTVIRTPGLGPSRPRRHEDRSLHSTGSVRDVR